MWQLNMIVCLGIMFGAFAACVVITMNAEKDKNNN